MGLEYGFFHLLYLIYNQSLHHITRLVLSNALKAVNECHFRNVHMTFELHINSLQHIFVSNCVIPLSLLNVPIIMVLLHRSLSKATISTYVRNARIFLRWVHAEYGLSFDPVKIKVPKPPKRMSMCFLLLRYNIYWILQNALSLG